MSSLILDTGSPVTSDKGSPAGCSVDTGIGSPVPVDDYEASPKGAPGSGRTRLSRTSKADCLLRMNRRVSMKPQRKIRAPTSSSEEDIKKFYLNNKLGSGDRQNALETIFEEPSVVRNELRLIGLKKFKRSMACKDGFTINKATVQSRRKKIKTLFGGGTGAPKKFNKLSMDAFLQHLQSLSEESEDALPQGEVQSRSQPSSTVVRADADSVAESSSSSSVL